MLTRIIVAGGVLVAIGAIFAAQATSGILAVLAALVFLWAVLGAIAPSWARLPDRRASVKVWGGSVVLVVVSFLVTLAQPEFRQELADQQAAQSVSLAEFRQIQSGMTYAQVVSVVGFQGTEASRSDLGGISTVMYEWSNSGLGGNMNAMFQDGRMVSKAQAGLD